MQCGPERVKRTENTPKEYVNAWWRMKNYGGVVSLYIGLQWWKVNKLTPMCQSWPRNRPPGASGDWSISRKTVLRIDLQASRWPSWPFVTFRDPSAFNSNPMSFRNWVFHVYQSMAKLGIKMSCKTITSKTGNQATCFEWSATTE